MRSLRWLALLTLHSSLLTVLGCRVSLSPVKNRIGVGVESYVIFDGDGENGEGDLYAGSASGGPVFRVTFSRVHEAGPALSPDGTTLAFIRGAHAADSTGHRVWIMNLLNGAEREVPVLGEGAYPQRLGWSLDGTVLYARTARGVFRIAAPPAQPQPTLVDSAALPAADTALGVPLGNPVAAFAEECNGGVCACTASGSQSISATGRSPLRWGSDSVGYFQGEEIEVRPLRGGSTRQVRWSGLPDNVRTATQFAGAGPVDRDQ